MTPQPPIISDLPVSIDNSTAETEKSMEQPPLNESIQTTSTTFFNNTKSETPPSLPSDQQIPYSSNSVSLPYFPPQITTIQNSSNPTFQVLNSQYSPQQLSNTSEAKPYVLTPQITKLPSFTSQESTTISTQEPSIIPMSLPQTVTTQELNDQSSNIFPPQSNYSQYHPTDVGGTTTLGDVPSSKEPK